MKKDAISNAVWNMLTKIKCDDPKSEIPVILPKHLIDVLFDEAISSRPAVGYCFRHGNFDHQVLSWEEVEARLGDHKNEVTTLDTGVTILKAELEKANNRIAMLQRSIADLVIEKGTK